MRDATSQANFGIVLRAMAIRRNDEANELRYVYAYVLLARYYSRYCNSRRSEYNAVPDKTKIKDDVTESWSLFILRQHDRLSPASVFLSRTVCVELDTRIIRNNRMIYCFTHDIDWNVLCSS